MWVVVQSEEGLLELSLLQLSEALELLQLLRWLSSQCREGSGSLTQAVWLIGWSGLWMPSGFVGFSGQLSLLLAGLLRGLGAELAAAFLRRRATAAFSFLSMSSLQWISPAAAR